MYSLIKNIYEKGFVKLYEPEALDMIQIDKFVLLNTEERLRDNIMQDVSSDLSTRLSFFAQYIKTKYIDPEWPGAVYNKFVVWEGVDKDNQGWHTDMFEGYDIFFLYYLDTMTPETGGSVSFKWQGLTDTESSVEFYPKAGDLFMVNNMRGFWHKAQSCSIKRRVVSFDFNVGLIDHE
jgi:hypothetical protein